MKQGRIGLTRYKDAGCIYKDAGCKTANKQRWSPSERSPQRNPLFGSITPIALSAQRRGVNAAEVLLFRSWIESPEAMKRHFVSLYKKEI